MKITSSRNLRIFWSFILMLTIVGVQDMDAQRKKRKKKKKGQTEQVTKPKPKKPKKSIASLTKSSKKIDGLFTIYQDTVTGSLKLLIKKEQLNKDFIYFSQIANGVTEANAFKGAYRGSSIFRIKKYFNKIEFLAPNTSFYFDKNNAISRSAKSNISDAIITSSKVLVADDKKGEYLIDATGLFLSEALTRIKFPRFPGQSPLAFSLGRFDKNKSKVEEIKNYPENTNIKTEYVYNNPSILNSGSAAVTDGRYVSIKVFHTFINMPEDDYKVRLNDPRVGYFLTETNDMTSTKAVNYRDLINRWKLIKKNPNAAISEPVTPIIWWIENTTPVEWRETIKEGVLAWNKAFEAAGFKNAMVVKVQPDDADWDAGDIRYNVLRWTSSPNPPFGGYGPNFANPRTGQVLGADIMLEYVHFTNRVLYSKVYSTDANYGIQSDEDLKKEMLLGNKNHLFCSKGHQIHENNMFGQIVLAVTGASDLEMEGIKKEAMKSLIMHEVGHTLGLNHNMKASHLFSPAQLEDASFIKGKALTSSVMDYTAINLTNDRSKQGQYYSTSVGPYDIWAIQYGYQDFKNDAEKEALLSQSTKPELIFGNDGDDMRNPGKGIDPRVMLWDLSNDQITYSVNRIKLVNSMMKDIKTRFSKKGENYMQLRRAYLTLNGQAATAANTISRFIGGVYVDRAVHGQQGSTQPYTPVSLVDQKRAMTALKKYVFAPNAFKAPKELYNYLARQPRGWDGFWGLSDGEDPKIQERTLGYQNRVLAHIMHPNTLQRISNSELYGNEYKLSAFMTDLNNAIFKPDVYGSINSFRQNLQIVYTKRLINMVTGRTANRFTSASQSMAIYNLKNIKTWVSNGTGNLSTKAHKNHIKTLISNALKEIK